MRSTYLESHRRDAENAEKNDNVLTVPWGSSQRSIHHRISFSLPSVMWVVSIAIRVTPFWIPAFAGMTDGDIRYTLTRKLKDLHPFCASVGVLCSLSVWVLCF